MCRVWVPAVGEMRNEMRNNKPMCACTCSRVYLRVRACVRACVRAWNLVIVFGRVKHLAVLHSRSHLGVAPKHPKELLALELLLRTCDRPLRGGTLRPEQVE